MASRHLTKPDRNLSGILHWEIAGALFIITAGPLFHFGYRWFGPSNLLAVLFPVNESVWEHLKLGYWSLIIFSLAQSLWMRWKTTNFWGAKGAGLVVMQSAILFIYYSYTSISGGNILALDLGSYVLGALLCQAISFWILSKSRPSRAFNKLGIWILVLHGLALVIFTFATPPLPIFKDGRTGTYGAP